VRKLALILATSALFGLAAPAFAVEGTTATQARTTMAQANVNTTAKAKVVRHRRGVNKLVRHDRGLHRGFTHSRHYGYGKAHHKPVREKVKANVTR
jgi:hypothetical protein